MRKMALALRLQFAVIKNRKQLILNFTLGTMVLFFVHNSNAQNNVVRPLSLKDCIQIALEHNLDIRIERMAPLIAGYRLNVASSVYEPVLDGGGIRTFDTSPGGVDEQNRPFPGTKTRTDEVVAGITGVLPTGLSYDLGGARRGQVREKPIRPV